MVTCASFSCLQCKRVVVPGESGEVYTLPVYLRHKRRNENMGTAAIGVCYSCSGTYGKPGYLDFDPESLEVGIFLATLVWNVSAPTDPLEFEAKKGA